MAKPLKETFFSRVWRLIHGVIFYNTVYWRRASDGLNPPKLSHDERQLSRPVRDLQKIRPRANPRAKIEAQESLTSEVSVPVLPEPGSQQNAWANGMPASLTPPDTMTDAETRHVVPAPKGRGRRKRRHIHIRPQGFFARWFS